ncbi:MAG: acyl-CoA dehydrogenase [Proteobacteria bacterium]|nr:acyl-CoA dehydrogenase [Pseudomonadota bacterium]
MEIKSVVCTAEKQFFQFAHAHIRPLTGLGAQVVFPEALWEKMGAQNLLNPALFTGQGLAANSCTAITRAGRALVHGGGNLGMALSWMVHHLAARSLSFSGDAAGSQKFQAAHGPLGSAIAKGKATVSFAVSEPGAGAHPKYMAATATRSKTGYVLNGEKIYLTNGPIAHAFVVIAVTGVDEGGKKLFSAFLVPKESRGLTVLPPMEIGFFNPSPHGSICMKDCRVPDTALLGRKDHAHGDRVLAFRQIEDAAMTGPVTGAMAFLLEALARKMATRPTPADGDVQGLGGLAVMMETAELLSCTAAAGVDDPASAPGPQAFLLAFKNIVREFVAALGELTGNPSLVLPDPCGMLIHDLSASARIGAGISQIQQVKLGREIIRKHL